MHIKSISIRGFKSYKSMEPVEFSEKSNVVVGRNGTGKSNFFNAIRFVLGDSNMNMNAEERQTLLHDGGAVMSAHVEIIFDNSDSRFVSVDTKDVVLRRTIGMKKDEYFINSKKVPRKEVFSLLESAGFSNANPFYIVQQGRVKKLCMLKDHERLELLKEVAGTKVYEDRRKEAVHILEDSRSKREKIEEVIASIEHRLDELSEEKNELAQCQSLDRRRRAIEYVMYEMELKSAKAELEKISESKRTETDSIKVLQGDLMEKRQELDSVNTDLKSLQVHVERVSESKSTLRDEVDSLNRDLVSLTLRVEDGAVRKDLQQRERERIQKDLEKKKRDLKQKKTEFDTKVVPDYKKLDERVKSARVELSSREARCEALYAKQGRSEFRNKSDRDAYLKKEIDTLNKLLADRQEQVHGHKSQVKKLKDKCAKEERIKKDIEKKAEKAMEKKDEYADDLKKVSNDITEWTKKRQEQWRVNDSIMSEVELKKQAEREALNALGRVQKYEARKGLESVMHWKETGEVAGIIGPIAQLFTVEEQFDKVIEAVAGNQLMRVVVKNAETARKCIKKLMDERGGRVTFIPLDDIDEVSTPAGVNPEEGKREAEAVWLTEVLQFEEEHRKAISHVFGRILLCKGLDVAVSHSRTTECTCVTLDGDKIDRKGAMYGGYVDTRDARMGHFRKLYIAQEQLQEAAASLERQKEAASNLERKVAQLQGEKATIMEERTSARRAADIARKDLARATKTIEGISDQIIKLERLIADGELAITTAQNKLTSLEAERKSPFSTSLTPDEAEELDIVQKAIREGRENLKKLMSELDEKSQRKSRLESQIRDNLQPQVEALEQRLFENESGKAEAEADRDEDARNEKEAKQRMKETKQKEFTEADASLRELEKELKSKTDLASKLRKRIDQIDIKLSKLASEQEGWMDKRRAAQSKREEYARKIRELGSLPQAEVNECREKFDLDHSKPRKRDLLQELRSVNEGLKKFQHVNKKALDQYTHFSGERERLKERCDEISEGASAIEELIQNLDQQKDNKIQETFRKVQQNFKEVFAELVEGGSGSLEIVTKDGDDSGAVDSIVGMKVNVSFGGGESLMELSGGQKSVVALALIFSIQRCDPQPFYLFDEIDAALDPSHRKAVADMIHRQSRDEDNPAQFITTTFKPEIAQRADKWFGVSYQKKESRLITQSREKTLEFIQSVHVSEHAIGSTVESDRKRRRGSSSRSSTRSSDRGSTASVSVDRESIVSGGGGGGSGSD